MENQIQVEKLDDIQLALYLAFVNQRGYQTKVQLEVADKYHEWLKSKRQEQTEENKKVIQQLKQELLKD